MIRNPSIQPLTHTLLVAAAMLGVVAGAAASEQQPPYVDAILEHAKQQAQKIPLQAQALAELAWPATGPTDPLVQAAARRELVGFGEFGLAALQQAIVRVDPLYQADAVAAFLEARYIQPAGMPPEFLPGLEQAIWFGSTEARRVALLEIGRYAFPPALLTSVDAAHDTPEIARAAMRSLGRTGDTRARIFLTEVLTRGNDYYKPEAAAAISALGGAAINILREATSSVAASTRGAAVRELLPHATSDDLSLLHEFPVLHPGDDPELLRSIRERATALELQLAVERDAEAASHELDEAPPDED